MPLLRRLLFVLLALASCVPAARAAVEGCGGTSRIAGCHALTQTPRGPLSEVVLSYVIAPGLAYVEPRIERAGSDVVRVYFIESDFVTMSPRLTRTLSLGEFAAGQYRVEIYEGSAVPPPLPQTPPQQVAVLGIAIGAAQVPATGPAVMILLMTALGLVGAATVRRAG